MVGEPSPSSSLRCSKEVVGREIVEDLRRGAKGSMLEAGGSEVMGLKREFVDEVAEGSVSESFFMFRERGLLGVGKMNESVSEVVEERVEGVVCVSADRRVSPGFTEEGVSMRRCAGGPRLRAGCEDNIADCGRGVAESMFWWWVRKRHAGVYAIEGAAPVC